MGLLERIGAVVVSPGAEMRRLAASRDGGLGDVAVLLGLRLLAGETRVGSTAPDSSLMLVRAALWLGKLEPQLALQGALQALSRLVPDVLGIVLGAVALALLAARRTRGRELDLAAAAWIPVLLVQTAVALVFSALGRDPSDLVSRLSTYLGLGWSAVCWALALWTLRSDATVSS
jgi:hypothetical protein